MDRPNTQASILDGLFFSLILGFGSGIVLEAFVSVSPFIFIGIGFGVMFVGLVSKKSFAIFAGIFLFAMLLGGLRLDVNRPNSLVFSESIGKQVTISGIAGDPVIKTSGIQFVLDTRKNVNISVTANPGTYIAYGDEVSVSGLLELPQNFMTDQGTEFDYISYLYKDDMLYQIRHAKVNVISHDNGNWIIAHLLPLKQFFVQSFQKVLPGDDASLLAGINLGEKSAIDKDFRNDLVTTGTIHIIALSGYNVTIVANALRDLFVDVLGFGVRVAGIVGGFGIVLFVIMTGLQSSAIRAGVMALIGLFARGEGRTYNAFRALLFAGFLMVLWNPKYLVYDVSFQLSFLATLGIIFITPILERKFRRVPKKVLFVFALRELMSVTLGAMLGVAPFILYKMGTFSFISLIANIVVLPAIPFAMGFGLLAGLIGMVSLGLAYPFAWITSKLLGYVTGMVSFFAKVPLASITLRHVPMLLCFSLYGIIVMLVYRSWQNRGEEKKKALHSPG
jgi:competence protein ComEC